ncbi:uncharacterized protein LOC103830939 isoform X1 [Brassica rapa]|uniref:uncharacterized protein LOC103830939 isoform X1 n=1 Tax=Brassica campestris TaxID=3711 RepID=UPI00142D6DF2|nr:uncharacterized protein LOC103830939 isoform X1 [Brassica rapa]
MGILLCCLRVPEQGNESRNVPRITAFSHPIMNIFPLKYEQLSRNLERREFSSVANKEEDVCPTCFYGKTSNSTKKSYLFMSKDLCVLTHYYCHWRQSTLRIIRKQFYNVDISFTLPASMNGWREVQLVPFVPRQCFSWRMKLQSRWTNYKRYP